MQERYGADLYAFGSRVQGLARDDSDYDLVAVATVFAGQRSFLRAPDRFDLWEQAGGFGLSLDLHCYTPEEFAEELEGLGYLGEAAERGELVRIRPDGQR
jgi:predicted nucleotidyltransferase